MIDFGDGLDALFFFAIVGIILLILFVVGLIVFLIASLHFGWMSFSNFISVLGVILPLPIGVWIGSRYG